MGHSGAVTRTLFPQSREAGFVSCTIVSNHGLFIVHWSRTSFSYMNTYLAVDSGVYLYTDTFMQ